METLSREQLRRVQRIKLERILRWTYDNSPFYRRKWDRAGVGPADIRDLEDLNRLPLVDKSEWLEAQPARVGEFSDVAAMPESEIVRYHQTSGTTGVPMRLGFSQRDWQFWLECWGYGLAACNLTPRDRALICFPFNLFVGWWGGLDAARLLRCRVYSGGGMTSEQRLAVIRDHEISALFGSPSYLLHLARVGEKEMGLEPARLKVRKLVCGAEPGGSIASTRRRLEQAWGAEVFDHLGASEVGPWGYECAAHPGGVHICEAFFLMEFVDPETGEAAGPGELAKLVITTLEKYTQPVIRFDVKDLVRLSERPCPCGRTFGWVEGGILGRSDDLFKVRGVLFSPRAVEDVVRSFQPCEEYRVLVTREGAMDELTLKVETRLEEQDWPQLSEELADALKLKTNLRFGIEVCPRGTLDTRQIKTRRILDLREEKHGETDSTAS